MSERFPATRVTFSVPLEKKDRSHFSESERRAIVESVLIEEARRGGLSDRRRDRGRDFVGVREREAAKSAEIPRRDEHRRSNAKVAALPRARKYRAAYARIRDAYSGARTIRK